MKEEEIYNLIEKVYFEKRQIQDSREFKLGTRINMLINSLKNKNFKNIREIIRSRHILRKYKKYLQVPLNDNYKEYRLYTENKKVVIYTCITGDYDDVYNPIIKEEKCDYILFTNNENLSSEEFLVKSIPEFVPKFEKNGNIMINRYIKFHPFELFEDKYDYAIYIDGNIRIISNISSFINELNKDCGIAMHKHCVRNCIYDEAKVLKIYRKGNIQKIEEQIDRYKKEGFPENFGLAEANVIVTNLKNKNAKKIFNLWWNEFITTESLRDQLAFPYIIWKNGMKMDRITTLGNNVYDNPKIERIRHKL